MNKPEGCPFCGNTSEEEFSRTEEKRLIGTPAEYTSFRFSCSCGATGPDADTIENAVELWNKRLGTKNEKEGK
ncbi:hypothetical protein FACS1894106_2800 [Spirochaetia bacterium]|nr:hypothetical protein FACS1894106_2800 [Spirochaetia bacterium]